jgi:hypothetical protein
VGDRFRPHLPQGQVGSFTTHVLKCFDDRCSMHPSAWNKNSRKSTFTILYSSDLSGRVTPYFSGLTHFSQHYMLCVG